MTRLLRGGILALLAIACAAAPAAAQSEPTWKIRPDVEAPLLALEATIAASWLLGSQLSPAACAPLCDPSSVWGIDRWAAGRYRPGWRHVSDIGVATILVGSLTVLIADEGFTAAMQDAVVWGEAVLGALALSTITDFAARRPRPYLYGQDAPESLRMNGTAALSFFSGHTASSFAGAVALFRTESARHPHSWTRWLVLGMALSMAATVGVSRVLAGDHFPTDVLVGAIVGSSIGWLVPALHEHRLSLTVQAAPTQALVGVIGVF
ncbi:MAG: phosphatase PAP2 family protein [Sandaracinaceae bacterium]|nr:phosphatase PAP2 family protein [Sandaracinaceae bacterium]